MRIMLLIIRSAIESARLSELRGKASENASRFNSRKPFHAVSRTSPRMFDLPIDGAKRHRPFKPAVQKDAEREESIVDRLVTVMQPNDQPRRRPSLRSARRGCP